MIYSVLREISNDFDDAGISRTEIPEHKLPSGQRRSLVEEYYASINWSSPAAVAKVLAAYETHLFRLGEKGEIDELNKLVRHLERDGVKYEESRLHLVANEVHLQELIEVDFGIDISQLQANVHRIQESLSKDTSQAMGYAKELVESTCKHILAARREENLESGDLPALIKRVQDGLDLGPTEVPNDIKGCQAVKRVLGSLANIVQGLAELRNLYGTGHGRGPDHKDPWERHARLCVNAAAALCLFLMETAKERSSM